MLSCQCVQNCHTLLRPVDAMCNSFNTRPCRSPSHCSNGTEMPPCIPGACTRRRVIPLIYSSCPVVDHGASLGFRLADVEMGRTLGSTRPSEVSSGLYAILSGYTSYQARGKGRFGTPKKIYLSDIFCSHCHKLLLSFKCHAQMLAKKCLTLLQYSIQLAG